MQTSCYDVCHDDTRTLDSTVLPTYLIHDIYSLTLANTISHLVILILENNILYSWLYTRTKTIFRWFLQLNFLKVQIIIVEDNFYCSTKRFHFECL